MQKYRLKWLREGDKNTFFFHDSLLNYKRKNKITTHKNLAGEKPKKMKEIEVDLVNHFNGLLKEPKEDQEEATQDIFRSILTLVSPEHNLSLMCLTNLSEVEKTIKEMTTGKSPSRIGLPQKNFILLGRS